MVQVASERVRQSQKDGTYAAAHKAARELEGLGLKAALQRVLSQAGSGPLYDALAVRWIAMAIESRQLTLYTAGWAAARFQEHLLPHRDCSAPLRRLASEGETAMFSPQVEGDETAKHLALVDEALEARDLQAGMRHAYLVPYLPLDRALRLTVLAGETSDSRFEAASQRFMACVLEEVRAGTLPIKKPVNAQIKKLVNCFVYFHDDFYGPFARDGLQGLLEQLRDVEPVDIIFEQAEGP